MILNRVADSNRPIADAAIPSVYGSYAAGTVSHWQLHKIIAGATFIMKRDFLMNRFAAHHSHSIIDDRYYMPPLCEAA